MRRGHDVRENVVALTFDDGPSAWTEQILDLQAAHDVHATFFVLGVAITAETRATVRGLRSVTVTELEATTEIRAPACAGTRRSARSSPNP